LTRWPAPPVDHVDVAAFGANRQPVWHGRVFDEQPTSQEIAGKPAPNGRLLEKLFPSAGAGVRAASHHIAATKGNGIA